MDKLTWLEKGLIALGASTERTAQLETELHIWLAQEIDAALERYQQEGSFYERGAVDAYHSVQEWLRTFKPGAEE